LALTWNGEPHDDPHAMTRDQITLEARLTNAALQYREVSVKEFAMVLCTKAYVAGLRGDIPARLSLAKKAWNQVQLSSCRQVHGHVLGIYSDALIAAQLWDAVECALALQAKVSAVKPVAQDEPLDALVWACLEAED